MNATSLWLLILARALLSMRVLWAPHTPHSTISNHTRRRPRSTKGLPLIFPRDTPVAGRERYAKYWVGVVSIRRWLFIVGPSSAIEGVSFLITELGFASSDKKNPEQQQRLHVFVLFVLCSSLVWRNDVCFLLKLKRFRKIELHRIPPARRVKFASYLDIAAACSEWLFKMRLSGSLLRQNCRDQQFCLFRV